MFKTRIAALALGLFAVNASTALADDVVTWYDDYDVAAAAAREAGKDLFVDFTGSDWCGWCIRLHDEVFAKEEFLSAVQEDYILVALDFPRKEENIEKVPNPERNRALQAKFGVRGFPTILLMSPEGHAYGKMGYERGGPANYVKSLAKAVEKGKPGLDELQESLAKFDAATGAEKEAAWNTIVEKFTKTAGKSLLAISYVKPITWALEYDADNAKGMQRRAIDILMENGAANDAVFAAAMKLDPKNEEGLYEKVVQNQFMGVSNEVTARAALQALDGLAALGFKDTQLGFGLHYQAARWAHENFKDPELAKKNANAAKAIGSDNAEAMKALDKILGS